MVRSLARSFLAILAGIVVGVGVTLATDYALLKTGIAPESNQSDGLFAVETTYRTIYGILSAWLIAWLAPKRPMLHVMIAGAIGFLVSILGAVVTWHNPRSFGPHWYPIALVLLALPQSWFGAKLHEWFTTSQPRV